MHEPNRCKYCGCKIPRYARICGSCYQKRDLIRRLRAIIFEIRRQAEEEKKSSDGGKDE